MPKHHIFAYAIVFGWPLVLVGSYGLWQRTKHLVYLLLPYAYLVAGLTSVFDNLTPLLVTLFCTAGVQAYLVTSRRKADTEE
jgi:hypothetical protein